MRVAFVSPFTARHGTTPARARTRRTARLLADRGHDVTVLCAAWWDGDHDTFEQDGVRYRRVSDDPASMAVASGLPGALVRINPDVIQTVNSPPSAALTTQLVGRLLRTPVVVDWWSNRWEDAVTTARRVARTADAILTPSRTIRTEVREYNAGDDSVRVVPESIDYGLVERASVDDRFDVVYSRRLDRHANVETFLLGLAELRNRDWTAAIVGDGPERNAIERVAADLRIDDQITFLGDLSTTERVQVFKGSHVFVQTARTEPFASDLLWALACGCVGLVEYQAASAAHELVEGRDRATLVTSPGELADEFVAASDLEERPIEESYAEYDHGDVIDRYLDCYRELRDDYGLF